MLQQCISSIFSFLPITLENHFLISISKKEKERWSLVTPNDSQKHQPQRLEFLIV